MIQIHQQTRLINKTIFWTQSHQQLFLHKMMVKIFPMHSHALHVIALNQLWIGKNFSLLIYAQPFQMWLAEGTTHMHDLLGAKVQLMQQD